MNNKFQLSPLPHTWIFDIDGTLVKHNGYRLDGYDTLLPGVKSFFDWIPQEDMIILMTSRQEKYREITECFLKRCGLRYNLILFNVPFGERILVNDDKPSGLAMAHCLRLVRDKGIHTIVEIDEEL